MTLRSAIARVTDNPTLNFVLTNWIPRRAVTRLAGRLSKIEQPLVRDASIAVWRLFSDLDLSEARTTRFRSLHDCFIRELKDGARPIDTRPEVLVSPCDAIVGASGSIEDGVLLQVKGSTYLLSDLVQDPALVAAYRNGRYVTLRLTSTMYHRFHAPHDARVVKLSHIPGDAWNVNPSTLERMHRIYCRNERAVLQLELATGGHLVTLVPVAAILVAGIRLNFHEMPSDRYHVAPWSKPCAANFRKGEEMGWFEHGSTIIVLAASGFDLQDGIMPGHLVRMGEPLMSLPAA